MSQQNAKHALSVGALQHNLEEVMLHHGNGSFNERSEVRAGALMMLRWLEREYIFMPVIMVYSQ